MLPAPPPFHYLASQPPPPQLQPAPAAPMPSLPDSLNCDGPNSPKAQGKLNPGAVEFSPTKPGRAAAAAAAVAAAGAARPAAQPAAVSGGPSVLLPPVIQSIYGSIEAALAGRSFVPAWDRMVQQHAMGPGQPLVVAETVECDSGTEGEHTARGIMVERWNCVGAAAAKWAGCLCGSGIECWMEALQGHSCCSPPAFCCLLNSLPLQLLQMKASASPRPKTSLPLCQPSTSSETAACRCWGAGVAALGVVPGDSVGFSTPVHLTPSLPLTDRPL